MREFFCAKWVHCKQAISSGMPVARMAKILGVIKNRDAHFLPLHFTVVIHPISFLTPNTFLTDSVVGIHHMSRRRVQSLYDADGKRALLGVTHPYGAVAGTY